METSKENDLADDRPMTLLFNNHFDATERDVLSYEVVSGTDEHRNVKK